MLKAIDHHTNAIFSIAAKEGDLSPEDMTNVKFHRNSLNEVRRKKSATANSGVFKRFRS